jgi:hypothetical protein
MAAADAAWQKGRVRVAVQRILEELLARHPAGGHVHLNDLAEVIGTTAVTPEEVEALVDELEAAGLRVGEQLDGADVRVMREVLASARRLHTHLSRRPKVEEIAEDSGHPTHVVRRALEAGARSHSARAPRGPPVAPPRGPQPPRPPGSPKGPR